jgi:hypothetical protein
VSIAVFFSLMIAGLASSLPKTLTSGLQHEGVPAAVAHHIGFLPPVSSLFAAVLGVNPVQHLLATGGVLASLPAASRQVLTGREFFPSLISGPFHHGLVVVFAVSAGLAALAGLASLLRGPRAAAAAGHPESAPAAEHPERSGPAGEGSGLCGRGTLRRRGGCGSLASCPPSAPGSSRVKPSTAPGR